MSLSVAGSTAGPSAPPARQHPPLLALPSLRACCLRAGMSTQRAGPMGLGAQAESEKSTMLKRSSGASKSRMPCGGGVDGWRVSRRDECTAARWWRAPSARHGNPTAPPSWPIPRHRHLNSTTPSQQALPRHLPSALPSQHRSSAPPALRQRGPQESSREAWRQAEQAGRAGQGAGRQTAKLRRWPAGKLPSATHLLRSGSAACQTGRSSMRRRRTPWIR